MTHYTPFTSTFVAMTNGPGVVVGFVNPVIDSVIVFFPLAVNADV
jgi:hypothetical protein